MKIDANTLLVLKNFAKINPGIIIKQGNVIKTISPQKTIIAVSNTSTVFEKDFCIYNLDRFIATLSLFEDPDLTFHDKYVNISDNKRSMDYIYCDEMLIKPRLEKEYVMPSEDIKFVLYNNDFKDVEKAMNILGYKNICITGDGKNIFIKTLSEHSKLEGYSVNIGTTDKVFFACFKPQNLIIIPDDYEVSLCKNNSSLFKGSKARYNIVLEEESYFE